MSAPAPEQVAAVREALEGLRAILTADGYDLEVTGEASGVTRLAVVAGPDACEDCLVPQAVFEGIATDHLGREGIDARLEIVYPAGGGH